MLLSRVIYTEKLHARQIEKSQECLKKAETELVNRVIEFDDITKKASDANNSMGGMLSDMSNQILILDERISMLSGSATVTGAGVNSWQKPQKMRGK